MAFLFLNAIKKIFCKEKGGNSLFGCMQQVVIVCCQNIKIQVFYINVRRRPAIQIAPLLINKHQLFDLSLPSKKNHDLSAMAIFKSECLGLRR